MNILIKQKHYLSTIAKLILCSLAIMLSPNSLAKVYKWIDENGKTHYSDKPFDDKSQVVEMKREPTNTEISEAKKRANAFIHHQNKVREIAEEDADQKKIVDAKKEKDTAELVHNCNAAKTEIRMLGRGFRSYTEDKMGKRHYLSDQEKEDKIAALQKQVQRNCNDL